MSSDRLKPTLGLAQLTFYGVGIILGAGTCSVIGAGAATVCTVSLCPANGYAFPRALSQANTW